MDFDLRSVKNQQSLIDQLRTKKHVKSMSCAPEHMTQSCDTYQQIPYLDSYQLTITWVSE